MEETALTEQEKHAFFSRLIAVKEQVAAASTWEGYVRTGPGVLFLNNDDSWYCPRRLIKKDSSYPHRRRLLAAIRKYNPKQQAIMVPWHKGKFFTVRIVTPAAPPEDAFPAVVGTPAFPPAKSLMTSSVSFALAPPN